MKRTHGNHEGLATEAGPFLSSWDRQMKAVTATAERKELLASWAAVTAEDVSILGHWANLNRWLKTAVDLAMYGLRGAEIVRILAAADHSENGPLGFTGMARSLAVGQIMFPDATVGQIHVYLDTVMREIK